MKRITFLILLPVLLACSLTQGAAHLPALNADDSPLTEPTMQVPTPQPITCTVSAFAFLNLREAPGTSSAVIAVLKHGEVLTILPHPAEGNWIRVKAESLEGWINKNYCETKGN